MAGPLERVSAGSGGALARYRDTVIGIERVGVVAGLSRLHIAVAAKFLINEKIELFIRFPQRDRRVGGVVDRLGVDLDL